MTVQRSIVVLAKDRYRVATRELSDLGDAKVIEFTANTRMSGVDLSSMNGGTAQIRKGAADSVKRFVESQGGTFPSDVQATVERIGLGLRAAVVDSEPGAVGMESSCDRRTDAPGGSRDEDDLVCERHGVGRHGHRCALEYGWRTYHDPRSRRC